MKHLVLVTLFAALLSACAGSQGVKVEQHPSIPEPYIPKHPDLVLPEPAFNAVTLKQVKTVTAYIQQALTQEPKKHPDLATFVEIVGGLYINAHRNIIMDCSDKHGWKAGPGMAMPECVWPRPSADDFVGCMALQFKGEEAFAKYKLSSLKPDESVFIWIDRNYDTINVDKEGNSFLTQLGGVAQLGAQCDQLTADEPPEGSIAI